MAQYAQYDPSASQPAHVIGWYDTSVLEYQSLPPPESLLEVNASEWALHFANPNGWAVSNGKLVEDSTPVIIQVAK